MVLQKCVMTSKKVMTMMMMMYEQQQHLEERVREMSQNVQQKLTDIVKDFNDRLDSREREIGETVGRKVDNLTSEICKKTSHLYHRRIQGSNPNE